jgi:hypothetical protein
MTALILPGLMLGAILATVWAVGQVKKAAETPPEGRTVAPERRPMRPSSNRRPR